MQKNVRNFGRKMCVTLDTFYNNKRKDTTHKRRTDMKKNDWKDRLNIVYSTNPDFRYEQGGEDEAETLDKNKQPLRVNIEKKGRGGKTVTVIKGFIKMT